MWKTAKLGEIFELLNGYAFKSRDYVNEGYFVMRITNVQQGYISIQNSKYIQIDETSKLSKFILESGDILISLTGNVGRTGQIKDEHLPCTLNQRVAKVDKISDELIAKNFLFHYFNSDEFRRQVEEFAHGAAQANVSTKDILSISLNLPPLTEQQRIVAKLDAVFAEIDVAVAAVKRKQEQVDSLKNALLSSELGAATNDVSMLNAVKLDDICIIDWGNTSLTKKSYVENGKYLAASATGVDGKIEGYEHEADVCVLSAIGAQCGKVFFPEQRFTAIKNTITLTPKRDKVNGKYLYYLFTHIVLPKRGSVQPFISKGDIQNFQIEHLPPLAEQQRIVAKLDAVFEQADVVKDVMSKQLANYQALKSALLSAELTGEAA